MVMSSIHSNRNTDQGRVIKFIYFQKLIYIEKQNHTKKWRHVITRYEQKWLKWREIQNVWEMQPGDAFKFFFNVNFNTWSSAK